MVLSFYSNTQPLAALGLPECEPQRFFAVSKWSHVTSKQASSSPQKEVNEVCVTMLGGSSQLLGQKQTC